MNGAFIAGIVFACLFGISLIYIVGEAIYVLMYNGESTEIFGYVCAVFVICVIITILIFTLGGAEYEEDFQNGATQSNPPNDIN